MKIQVGDKVKFLNDVGGGTVVKIVDQKTAMVLTEDGFDFPFLINELIINEDTRTDNSGGNQEPQKPEVRTLDDLLDSEEEIVSKDDEEVNIYLAFVPEDASKPTTSHQQLNIVNDSNWSLMYAFQIRRKDKFETTPGVLQPNFVEELQTYSLQGINEIKEIVVQIIFFRKTPYDVKEPVIKRISIKPQRFYNAESFVENDYFDQKAFMFPIVEDNPIKEAMDKLKDSDMQKIIYEKEIKNNNTLNKSAPKPKPNIVEIDLHIEELLDNTIGMESKDILNYQMKVFNEELIKAKKNNKVKKIVFIHGKGNGILKTKIRAFLDRNKINYQDASFQKYGFGATLIFV